jgi:NDP-sugar pyrophosphorylase family protein
VPILDDAHVVVGLHLLSELVGGMTQDAAAVVMAGGQGVRLRPLTEHLPKPMVPVAGRPILERIVLHLVGHGIRRIWLAVNYMADVIERHFHDGSNLGCEIGYLREEATAPLGTAGPLRLLPAAELDHAALLVMNGDLVTSFDASGLLATHATGVHDITIGAKQYVHQVPYGVIEVVGDRVESIVEKPVVSWSANAGIYALRPSVVQHVADGKPMDMPMLVSRVLARGGSVGMFAINDEWIDIGRPAELHTARGELP